MTGGLGWFHHSHERFGHGHVLDHRVTRRRFLELATGGAAVIAAGSLMRPAWAQGPAANPKPINGGAFPPYRFYFPEYKQGGPPAVFEQSSITDFNGIFASTDLTGWGRDNTNRELYFRCDMRMMSGEYVGVDNAHHNGSFGFI